MANSSYSSSITYAVLLVALVATAAQASSISKNHGEATSNSLAATARTAFGEARTFGPLTMLILTALPGLLLLLLLLPIPVVPTFAAAAAAAPFFVGRSADGSSGDGITDLWRVRSALEANSCVQRISCEIIKSSTADAMSSSSTWVRRILSGIPMSQEFKSKISSASDGLRECTRIKCDPVSTYKNMFSA